jgi:chromate transporter
MHEKERAGSALEVLVAAGKLGLTSFGGPIAHIGYFRDEYVRRRSWLSEDEFAELVGLSQSLPGPASSQLGIAIGMRRAGLRGGIAAWIGFTAPSAVALIGLAGFVRTHDVAGAGWVQGLKLVAVAVVAHAVFTMWRALVVDGRRAAVALAAAAILLLWSAPLAQVAVIGAGGVVGRLALSAPTAQDRRRLSFSVGRRTGVAALATFSALLVLLPVAQRVTGSHSLALLDALYHSGALVFGGGHVVLPLLEARVVDSGWVSEEDFLAGYGATQAVPGPLFTFAGYLGAVQEGAPNGVVGGSLALVAIFLPGSLLLVGVLPFWSTLRRRLGFSKALAGVNAAVVGLLLAALVRPVLTSAVDSALALVVALGGLGALLLRAPPLIVVLGCVLAGLLVL